MKGAVPGAEAGVVEDEGFGLFWTSEKYRWTAHIGYKSGTLHAGGKEEMAQAVVGDCFFGRLNSSMVVQFCWKRCQARTKEAVSCKIKLTLLSSAPISSGSLSVEETHSIEKMTPVGLGFAGAVAEMAGEGDSWQTTMDQTQSTRAEHSDGRRHYLEDLREGARKSQECPGDVQLELICFGKEIQRDSETN